MQEIHISMEEVKNYYAGSQKLLCRKEGKSKGSPERGLKWPYMTTEITRLNTSEFLHYLDELYRNELVFAFSFVSSNNTDVETTEQFVLMHTRYVCDFSGLTNYSQKLWNSKKTFISYFVYFFGFLAFDPRWIRWCLPRKEVSPWDCLIICL